MAETPSKMLPLGSKAKDFSLTDPRSNKLVSLRDYPSSIATVIMFLCNHCPYVKHIQTKLVEIAKAYQQKGKSSSTFKIIFSPIFRFIRDYFFKLGFLDGKYGFVIARLTAKEVYLKYLLLKKLIANG